MIKVMGNNYYTFTEGIESQKETKEGFAAAFSELVQKQRQEYVEKIKNGTTEPSYQIGAGSYTKKEWDKLLESFDKAEEAFRKELEEEKAKEEQKKNTKDSISDNVSTNLLCSDYISCTCTSESSKTEDLYIIAYDSQGIRCVGQKGCVWEIKFNSELQYSKVKGLIDSLDSKENFEFISEEKFWKEFLEK